MTVEDKYLLREPGYGDTADIGDINHNTDLIANGMYQNRLMIGKAYNPDREEPYMKGDLVVKQTTVLEDGSPVAYNFEYYKALEDNITGVWDASKWELTDISTELATKGGADVTKTASGNPIEITDGASAPLVKCVTQITGSQDLHGYDKPWVGGSGKNKLPKGTGASYSGVTFTVNDDGSVKVVADGTATNTYSIDIQVTLKEGVTYTASGITGGSSSTYQVYLQTSSGGATSAGNFTDGSKTWTQDNGGYAVGIYRIRVVAGSTVNTTIYPQIEEGSTATTFAPYSNICPITAYTEGEIEVRGKNLFDSDTLVRKSYASDSEVSQRARPAHAIKLPIGTSVTISFDATFLNTYRYSRFSMTTDFPSDSLIDDSGWLETRANTYTTSGEYYGFLIKRIDGNAIDLADLKTHQIQIEIGTSATDYEPYTFTTHTTTYPSAIYRGSMDFARGVLRVTHAIEVFDNTSTISFGRSGRDNWYYNVISAVSLSESVIPISNKYDGAVVVNDNYNLGIYKLATGTIRVRTGGTQPADTSAFVADLGTTPLQVVYELPTPIEIPITPAVVRTLSGYTHIESSTGDMEVEYITEEFQPIVDLIEDSKASSGHTYSTEEQVVGKWIDGSDLYEKTIATGAITIGSGGSALIDTISDAYRLVDATGYIIENGTCFALPEMSMRVRMTSDKEVCLNASSGWDISEGYITIRYTKTTPTRSLNLTKSAVEEIPDEIKNAEYEEKPDVNEADDNAPTEVDER